MQEVTDTFNAVHNYLAANPAVEVTQLAANYIPAGTVTKIGDIELGDYIDLVSLTIAADSAGKGGLTASTNGDFGTDGKLLRLIVVGINSFNHNAPYTGNGNASQPHLVFQFQNLPVRQSMNLTRTVAGGYAASDMRKYLVKVGTNGGNFLEGLEDAGVPMDVIWAPKRYVSNGDKHNANGADLIEDKLWLPTEREMFGYRNGSSDAYETEANQTRLAYYSDGDKRIKSEPWSTSSSPMWYWMASPCTANSPYFCLTGQTGGAGWVVAIVEIGCAPAFCVR
ncbi:hypothetical protein FACS1894190_04110 [Spirochaetia bacterium]|nr:hypothetical protein FACS1894190_04110 [Spirochaetia bacterium]